MFNLQRRGRLRPEKYPFFHDEKFTRVRETKIDPFGGTKPRLLSGVKKRRSGSTLSKPRPLVLSAVEGSGRGVEGLT